jgi:hypothetical protein
MNLREPHACERCGAWIESPNQRGKPQRFCSKRCASTLGLREFTCQVCSRRWVVESPVGQPPRYCSEDCRKEAAKARASEWYYTNPERVGAQASRQPEARATYWAAYYEANREAMIQRTLDYFRDHPEAKRARDAARYAMTRGASEAERFTLDEIYARDHGVCYLCGKDVTKQNWSMDHVIPVVLGGPHTRANVRLAHRSCNSRKRHQLLPEGVFGTTKENEDVE